MFMLLIASGFLGYVLPFGQMNMQSKPSYDPSCGNQLAIGKIALLVAPCSVYNHDANTLGLRVLLA